MCILILNSQCKEGARHVICVLHIKISTLSARKNDKRKDKNNDDDEVDDDDKARELNYDLEINIYFDNAFEKRSTAPKWNDKKGCWEEFNPKKHGYNYYDKDIQGWDHTNDTNNIIVYI